MTRGHTLGLAILLAGLLAPAWPGPLLADPSRIEEAIGLVGRIRDLSGQGRQAEALPLAREVLAILEAETGPESPETATFLGTTAGLHDALEQYAAAVPLYEKALAIKAKALGPDHPELAVLWASLAWDLDALGETARARPAYERALAIREHVLGPEHPDTVVAVNNLACLEESAGNHATARALHQRALAANERLYGPDSPEVANSANNLAGALASLALFDQAKALYERALAIQEKTLGPDHLKLAMTLNNLAQLEKSLGDFEAARGHLERSLAIREKALGPSHPDTALGRNNLAGLLDALGEYDRAKPLYERSLADLETALGPDHPNVAACLGNLASVLSSLGDPDAARPLLDRALAIWEKHQGPDGEDVARILNNLALLHFGLGEYGEARALLGRAATILKTRLGPDHPLVATVQNALAGVAQATGDLALARTLGEQTLAIREKVLGLRHLETAISLSNLAGIDADLGRRAEAVARYRQSLAIMEAVLGPSHPYTARVLNNLARVLAADGQTRAAFDSMRRGQAIDAASIEPVMAITSDAQKLKYLATLEATLHDFQSLVAMSLSGDAEARLAAFSAWLGRKGIVLEAQRRFQEALFLAADPHTLALARELAEVRGRLSRLTFAGPGLLASEALRDQTARLDRDKSVLEARLSAAAGPFARERRRAAATPADLAAALPRDSALLELCRYEVSDFSAPKRKTGTFRYLAYVLRAGRPGQVDLVDLGPADAVDQGIAALKAAIRNPTEPGAREAAKASRALHDLVFAPLRRAIGPSRNLFVSPDGNLNLMPFEVLLGPDDRYLIEDFTFNYLAAGRDLLEFAPAQATDGPVVLFGDPDFNRKTAGPSPAGAAPPARPREDLPRGLDDLRFSRLPGTREEVLALAALLGPGQCRLFLEAGADEQALSGLAAPRILHLATHGFFLGDQTLASLLGPEFAPRGTPTRHGFENPLLRAGLALAGANEALAAGSREAGRGIVTAEKILALNLHGTRLVVLSACETGLGQVRAGEGVFGLRRAFAQAGARSLVMSMWSVPDLETKELMVALYRALGRDGLPASAALRRAALEEMAVVRARYGWPHPFFWGAFVFLGQP